MVRDRAEKEATISFSLFHAHFSWPRYLDPAVSPARFSPLWAEHICRVSGAGRAPMASVRLSIRYREPCHAMQCLLSLYPCLPHFHFESGMARMVLDFSLLADVLFEIVPKCACGGCSVGERKARRRNPLTRGDGLDARGPAVLISSPWEAFSPPSCDSCPFACFLPVWCGAPLRFHQAPASDGQSRWIWAAAPIRTNRANMCYFGAMPFVCSSYPTTRGPVPLGNGLLGATPPKTRRRDAPARG
jgi:hypothetical protein